MLDKIVKVLIVDDSVLFRETLARLISEDKHIEVVGKAGDAYQARDMILQLHPDVVTLDAEMPKMNGIDFLKKLIPQYSIPVIIVSSSAINTFNAIDAGAVDFVKKPVVNAPSDMKAFATELKTKIMIASMAKILKKTQTQNIVHVPHIVTPSARTDMVIALGASTGGTDALLEVVKNFTKDCPPVVIVQHMPPVFTKMYAERLDRICEIDVKEAENGDRLRPGLAIIGAGEYHLRLAKDANGYYVTSKKGDKVSGHCPSVDVLFNSVAEVAKDKAIGAILTGMGADGAKGILAMKKAGAYTIGQNKETCVVYGMPMVAYNIGGVCEQAPLDKIADVIYKKLNSKR